MNKYKFLTALFFNAIMAMLLATIFSFNPAATFGVLVAVSLLVKMPKGVALMGLDMEAWETDIVENLFKNNQFAERAFNADSYVANGAVVHIPNAGAPLASRRNETNFPISAVKRTDGDVVYPIDIYFQPGIFVQNVEQATLAYDKRQSVAGEQQKQLIQDSMEGLLYNWAWKTPAIIGNTPSNFVPTSGGATAVDVPSGAVGSRLTFSKAVFSPIKKAMDIASIPDEGRIALLNAYHYQQFIDSLDAIEQTNFYRTADMQRGVVGSYLGFEFMKRASVQQWRYAAGVWTPVDTLAAGFAASDKSNDSFASLIYQQDCVERARGAINVYYNPGRTEYYGDTMSCDGRIGGRQRRSAGVYAVVDAIA